MSFSIVSSGPSSLQHFSSSVTDPTDAANQIELPIVVINEPSSSLTKACTLKSHQTIDGCLDEIDSLVQNAAGKIRHIQPNSESIHQAISPELTVIIPVYNEQSTILQVISAVRALPISKQIIVVNDGSYDATAQQLAAADAWPDVMVIHHDVNRGKGAALQTGFAHAAGEFVVVQDADLEYDPNDIMRVIKPLRDGESQVVYGSRYLEHPRQDPSWLHRFGNGLLTGFSNLMTGHRLTDMETCYKAFRRDVVKSLNIQQNRFGFEPEVTAKLARQEIAIQEVGVSYRSRGRHEGKKIGWRDLVSTLYCIVRYNLLP